MSVDTRVHITGSTLHNRAVVRRTTVMGSASGDRYCKRKAVAVQDHNGDEIRVTLEDLGAALRVLKISARDLGYRR